MQAATTSLPIGLNAWTNILISFDLTNSSNRYIYINDVAASVSWYSYGNSNIDFTRSTHYIGAWGNGTRKINDNMAHFYLDYTYRDLSTESNRRIFIDANGGSTAASTLTALNPIMYLPMTTAYAVGKNAGTGGDFTVNGSPTIVENGTEYVAGSGEGGLVWMKNRNVAYSYGLLDTERGLSKLLRSDSTGAELPYTEITSFNSDGFTLGNYSAWFNQANQECVSWSFRKAPGFFDIVTYTGNGTARAINHNLGSIPGFMVVKKLNSTSDWTTYHRSMGATKYAPLNDTDPYGAGVAIWNNTEPTSTQFTVGDNERMNNNGDTYVAYLFAHDAQEFGTDSDEAIIKCGSYTGNGSTDGPTINLGFEPQWLLFKNTTASAPWSIYDVMRGITFRAGAGTGDDQELKANVPDAEGAVGAVNINPNGFQLKGGQTSSNSNGATHIYIAIRRPNKPAEEFAATDLFTVVNGDGTGAPSFKGVLTDFKINTTPASTQDKYIGSRLQGSRTLRTNDTSVEGGSSSTTYDFMNGWSGSTGLGSTWTSWMWRRAPGYFDVVAYNGTGSATTIAHNLGVAPEMIWQKVRTASGNWELYLNAGGTEYGYYGLDQKYVGLNASLSSWNNTSPTDSVVSISSGLSNASHSYIMYLFASVPGISKIGTYSGTGSELTVDCGFSAGARFVLIKRANGSMGADGESYFVFDTVRGITSSSSPYLPLNDTDAQTTGSFIKPSSGGFIVTTASVVNTNGSTYAFYAIA